MTPDAALAQLQAMADPARAAQMRACHKQTRAVLGLSNATTGDLAAQWRTGLAPEALVALAQGLWASDIFDARILAGKLLLQARIRPDDAAVWSCITGFVADFDSWAIADAVAQGGQKRLLQDPSRLDTLEGWITSDHMWTRRAALVFSLPFTKARHPGMTEAAARAHPWLVRNARPGPRQVHPESHRLVAARSVQARARNRRPMAGDPWQHAQTLRPNGSGPPSWPLTPDQAQRGAASVLENDAGVRGQSRRRGRDATHAPWRDACGLHSARALRHLCACCAA